MPRTIAAILILACYAFAQPAPEILGVDNDTVCVFADGLNDSVTGAPVVSVMYNNGSDVQNNHLFIRQADFFMEVTIDWQTESMASFPVPFMAPGKYDIILINGDNSLKDTLADALTYIDNWAPSLPQAPDTVALEDSSWKFIFRPVDDDGDSVEADYYFDFADGMTRSAHVRSGDTIKWVPTNYDVGNNIFTLDLVDRRGAIRVYRYVIRVINTPDAPVFDRLCPSVADTVVLTGDTVHFQAPASDPDNAATSMIYTWFVNGALWPVAGCYPDLPVGTSLTSRCSVKVIAFDGSEQSSHTWHLTVGYIAQPIVITAPAASGAMLTGDSTLAWTFNDPLFDSAATRYRIQFSSSAAFSSILAEKDSLQGKAFLLRELVSPEDLTAASYVFVRVMAYNDKGWATLYSASPLYFLYLNYGTGADAASAFPKGLSLHQNFPNPFSASTAIRLAAGAPGTLSLRIYDIQGRMVKSFNADIRNPGFKTFSWDGRDNEGQVCRNGLYLCRLLQGKSEKRIRITLLK